MQPHPVEEYLRSVRSIQGRGVPETSYYPAVVALMNAVGAQLSPKVHCISHPKSSGSGIADAGLYTQDQRKHEADLTLGVTLKPSRGVIEIKSPAEDALVVAKLEQVRKYLAEYGQVLVTNLREFVLVGPGVGGEPVLLETYRLAASAAEFAGAGSSPMPVTQQHGDRLVEYLKRVMLHPAPLSSPKDLAWFMASYARDAMLRIETSSGGLDALGNVRQALEQSLGLTFEGERGDHFFRSTLVQTLFYGVFSGWVLWSKRQLPNSRATYDWKDAGWELQVPLIRALFHELVNPSTLKPLGLDEVLDWTGTTLNRVDRLAFFERFAEEQAVQHFYEPFLEAFDPDLRKQLGVWYTPPEVVRYMVERVDTVLREELGIAAGLADESVYVLDPATGTGSFLVEVLRRIHRTLTEGGGDALTAEDVKRAAMQRVFGFEIMPAPFVVAHLQLGLLLQNIGAGLSDELSERVGVYLTNALTGWEAGDTPRQLPFLPELALERTAADGIKRAQPILVILGNPPYNGYAGIAMAEERELTSAYRVATRTRQPQGQGLNDLYVRFFRMAERKIVEGTGRGVVCYISNYSWLDGLSFTAMRERYLDAFDRIWIDNLHGDRIISEYAPDGRTSETVFATQGFSVGIKVGTSISLLSRADRGGQTEPPAILYRDMDHARASERRSALIESLDHERFDDQYEPLSPVNELGLPFKPMMSDADYLKWPLLPNIFPTSFPGVKTSRDDVLVDIDRDDLVLRMANYFDPNVSHGEMQRIAPGSMNSTPRFQAEVTRNRLRERGMLPNNIVRYCYRPFDVRWLYWEPETKLLDEKRSEYFPHVSMSNRWIAAQQKPRREWSRPQVITSIGCLDLMDRGATCIPMFLARVGQPSLFDNAGESATEQFNLSAVVIKYLSSVDCVAESESMFFHSIAILHSAIYRNDNAGALRQDWPRIPLPNSRELLLASADLGRRVAALLDTEQAVPGVTTNPVRDELRAIGVLTTGDGGPVGADGLAVTAGWGRGGQNGVTMPGRGKTEPREYTGDERAAIVAGAAALGLSEAEAFARLGPTTRDVYLNERVFWRNVPERVWNYTIGGYQVMKKWLSYREGSLLGRPLKPDEAREVSAMTRRIASILLLESELDASYAAVKGATWAWGGGGEERGKVKEESGG